MPSDDAVNTLLQTVFTVVCAQVAGYVAKKSGKITAVGEYGIGAYIGTIGLPALLFRSTATLWQLAL